MRTFLRLLLLCSIAASAHAATWSPYIGLGGQANIIGSYSRHHGPLGSDNAWRGYPGYGGQIECGLASDRYDVYLAYRHSSAESGISEYRSSTDYHSPFGPGHIVSEDLRRRWIDHRLLLGGRVRLASPREPIRPLVGFTLSFGQPTLNWVSRSTASTFREDWGSNHSEQTETHTSDLSWFLPGGRLEFGFALCAPRNFSLNVLSSVEIAPARFTSGDIEMPEVHWHTLLSPALNLTSRYTFSSLHFGH